MQYKTGKMGDSDKSVTGKKSGYDIPWVERYRPRILEDIVGNEETLSRLRSIGEDGNMPNLILCGPPGTGKTTSVHALARQLLGSEKSYATGVLELNASDARGIDVVRNKIKGFAMNKVNLPPGRYGTFAVRYSTVRYYTKDFEMMKFLCFSHF